MSPQADYVVSNGTGAAVRSDINNQLAAIVSNNSGATEPATMYAYQWWADTTTGLLKIRNAANNAWVTVGTLASTNLGLLASGGTLVSALGSASTPGITFTGDLNTGIYSPGADQVSIATGGSDRLSVDASGNVTINAQGDLRFADSDSSNWVAFQAPGTVASNVTWTLPSADGTSGQALTTNGSGTLSWASAAAAKISVGNTEAEVVDTGVDGHFKVTTEGTERARIDSSGRLLVGTSTSPSAGNGSYSNLVVGGQPGASTSYGNIAIVRNQAASALVTNSGIGGVSFCDNTGGTFADILCQADATPGSNDFPGRLVLSTTADGASSPTERMRITNSGTALIGKTSDSFSTQGLALYSGQGSIDIVRSGNAGLFINRLASDGDLVQFWQDTSLEGTISVSGTTVSYNGAHLSRWSQLPSGAEREEILRGSVLSNIDEMCEWTDEENEQLNRMKVSDVEGDKNVSGVFQAWDDDDDTYTNDFYCAMTGDFIIRIGADTTVERGDLLMSAGDGTAKPQEDDIIRSKTIAKVTSTTVSCTYDDGSYCVPCVLMAC
jgi:hypothetical protein